MIDKEINDFKCSDCKDTGYVKNESYFPSKHVINGNDAYMPCACFGVSSSTSWIAYCSRCDNQCNPGDPIELCDGCKALEKERIANENI